MGFKVNTDNIQKPAGYDNTPLPNGLHDVAIEKCEYTESTQNNLMLKIQYKTLKEGRLIFDQIMDDPTKQVNAYRLSRLLAALGIDLKGEIELRDLPKVITKGRKLTVAVITKEGSNFTNIDISQYEGYYPYGKETTTQPELKLSDTVPQTDNFEIAETDDDY